MTSRHRYHYRVLHLAGSDPATPMYCDRHGRVSADGPDDLPLVVLVDAGRCGAYAVDLPHVGGRRLEQALRWAVEEHLADDASGQHVVACGRDRAGRMRCLVVEPDLVDDWSDRAGNEPVAMLPDAACLPWAPGELVVLPDGGDLLVRWGEFAFDRIPRDVLEAVLDELLAAAGDAPAVVHYGDPPPPGLPRERLEVRPAPDSVPALLAGQVPGNPADLLGGRRRAGDRARLWRHARTAAGLAVAAALLLAIHAAVELRMLDGESERLESAIQTRLAEVFPDIGRVQRPRVQAERELARLRYGRDAGALRLLARLDPLLAGAGGVQVRSLIYADGELRVDLEAADVADLEALRARMAALELDGRLEDVSVGPDTVSGRIRVRERGA